MQQLLQNATILLPKCYSYYEIQRYTEWQSPPFVQVFFLRKRKETDSFKFRKIELILIRLWICWPALLIKNSTPNVQNGAYCHLICDYLTEVSLPIATITGSCEHSKDGFINHHFKILMEHPKL